MGSSRPLPSQHQTNLPRRVWITGDLMWDDQGKYVGYIGPDEPPIVKEWAAKHNKSRVAT